MCAWELDSDSIHKEDVDWVFVSNESNKSQCIITKMRVYETVHTM